MGSATSERLRFLLLVDIATGIGHTSTRQRKASARGMSLENIDIMIAFTRCVHSRQ